MKILAIMGSARKGNTYRAVQRIEENMKKHGDVDFEYLFLKDQNLEACRGCTVCILKGEQKCPLKDSRAEIEAKMLSAAGVIFASPNYASNVSGLMKTLIDRIAYAGHRARFFEQHALYVVTSAGPGGMKECMAAMYGPLSHFGFRTGGKLALMTPPFKLPQRYAEKNNREIDAAALQFYKAIKNKGPAKPSLMDVVGFRSIQTMGNQFAAMYETVYPADHQYWKEKGWMDQSKYYYTEAKIGPITKMAARIMVALIMVYLKRTLFSEAGNFRPAGQDVQGKNAAPGASQ
ncbi:flavodoxin family protein [Methanocella sp. MCL-LM]|uniref:flavodoxin family protein n=1 Tax=Methanocella sp. MCL-LM TaxID=3412035 RepID=UPI003C790E5D